DPSGAREMLTVLALSRGDRLSGVVEHDRTGARRALVDRDDELRSLSCAGHGDSQAQGRMAGAARVSPPTPIPEGRSMPASIDAAQRDWLQRVALAETAIPIIGTLHRERNVIPHVHGRKLVNRSATQL